MKNFKSEYKYGTKVRMRVVGKESFQRKSFSNVSVTSFSVIKYLPSTSYYSIKDAGSERTIIDFSENSKISCDTSGNYFDLQLSGIMPQRYYKIIIKVVINGVEQYFDKGFIFKVVK